MKILLIGNYLHNKQQSMQRFAELMRDLLVGAGNDAWLVQPPAILGKVLPAAEGIGKWLGYIDRFVLFRDRLRKEAAKADVVLICDQANAVYVPMLHGKPHLVTCHDMLAIRSALGDIPGHQTGWSGRFYQRWILSGLRHAQQVVCVSEQTRHELLAVGGLPLARTSVVPNALNYPYRPMPFGEARSRLRALRAEESWRYFLHVGGNQWYKNRPGVVHIFGALASLPQFAGHHLILAGKPWPRELRATVEQYKLTARVHEWIDVSNEELRALYSGAEALIFPSLQEGFGWPIAEAQACGCPVFTSNRPPMTEVGGSAAVYIDPGCPLEAAQVIAERISDSDGLARRGLENAKRFAAEAMSTGYLDVLYKLRVSNTTKLN
jgi:glycosyltransferase involved in cell wall biosynthesis